MDWPSIHAASRLAEYQTCGSNVRFLETIDTNLPVNAFQLNVSNAAAADFQARGPLGYSSVQTNVEKVSSTLTKFRQDRRQGLGE